VLVCTESRSTFGLEHTSTHSNLHNKARGAPHIIHNATAGRFDVFRW